MTHIVYRQELTSHDFQLKCTCPWHPGHWTETTEYLNLRPLLCLLLFPHVYYYGPACNKNVGMFMNCYGWVFTQFWCKIWTDFVWLEWSSSVNLSQHPSMKRIITIKQYLIIYLMDSFYSLHWVWSWHLYFNHIT